MSVNLHPVCPFCKPVEKGSVFSNVSNLPYSEEIVWRGQDFSIYVDIAPLSAGHCLIVTNNHITNFKKWWETNSVIIDNLEKRILKVAQDVLGSKVIFFEHGQLGEVAGNSSCISHAHIHAFPNNSIKVDDINGFENVTFSFSKDGFQNEEGQYFAMKDVEGVYTFAFDHELPSQFFRRFLAQKLKQQFWNWQDYVQFSSLLGTAKKIELGQSFFKELHRSLVKNNDIN